MSGGKPRREAGDVFAPQCDMASFIVLAPVVFGSSERDVTSAGGGDAEAPLQSGMRLRGCAGGDSARLVSGRRDGGCDGCLKA